MIPRYEDVYSLSSLLQLLMSLILSIPVPTVKFVHVGCNLLALKLSYMWYLCFINTRQWDKILFPLGKHYWRSKNSTKWCSQLTPISGRDAASLVTLWTLTHLLKLINLCFFERNQSTFFALCANNPPNQWFVHTDGQNFGLREWRYLGAIHRDHFVYVPSQWEMTLQCNIISHWLGAYTKWSLIHCLSMI